MVYQVYLFIMHVGDVFKHKDGHCGICYPMLDRYEVPHPPPKDQCMKWIEDQLRESEQAASG